MFKKNKKLLFATCGFLGGLLGGRIGDSIPDVTGMFLLVLRIAAMTAIVGAAIAPFLFWAQMIYARRSLLSTKDQSLRVIIQGAVAGAIAGALAQFIYGFASASEGTGIIGGLADIFVRPFCWGILGVLLGWRLSGTVPNLGAFRGAVAGALGGVCGGLGYLLVAHILNPLIAATFGCGIIGMFLGLAIVLAEQMFRSACLEIVWAPGETSEISLGKQPISIGGAQDDLVYVTEYADHAGSIVQTDGSILYTDNLTHTTQELQDGSKLTFGNVDVIVHLKNSADKPPPLIPVQTDSPRVATTTSAPTSAPVVKEVVKTSDSQEKPAVASQVSTEADPGSESGPDWLK